MQLLYLKLAMEQQIVPQLKYLLTLKQQQRKKQKVNLIATTQSIMMNKVAISGVSKERTGNFTTRKMQKPTKKDYRLFRIL